MKTITYNMTSLALALGYMLSLSACNTHHEDHSTHVSVNPPVTAQPSVDSRDQRFLTAQEGHVLVVVIDDLIPTQGAIGYDQIYYKLGRWQGDLHRATWQTDPANQLMYLNKTIGKKFSDYCEAIGAKAAADFASIQDLQRANLKDLSSFACQEKVATEVADLKTVVVGYDGKLYLTDGHHTMTEFKELPDGGGQLKVWVKVVANYSDLQTADEFWAKLASTGRVWLKDGENQVITYQQLPRNLGLLSVSNPNGMPNNPYRSLVYFTRDIGYSKVANATDYTEFLWEDWFQQQIIQGRVLPLSFYHTDAKTYGAADVLATSSINADLTVTGSTTGYQAAVANYAILMGSTKPTDIIYATATAADLGALMLEKNAKKDSVTATSIANLADLTRDEIKKDKTPRAGGSLWYAVNYAACGKPQTGTCWGW